MKGAFSMTNPQDKNLPTVIWSGSFRVLGVDVRCHVLDDGRRIIDAESMEALFGDGVLGKADGDISSFEALAVFARGTGVPS